MNTSQPQNKYGLSFQYSIENDIEIGIDEAGRGPLFGRLYVAGVILPKDGSFDYSEIRDSKKITSKSKIFKLAEYIKQKSIAWYIHSIEAEEIDEINIRQAVLKAMRECIRVLLLQMQIYNNEKKEKICLLIDGNDFPPYIQYDTTTNNIINIPHVTIPGGDNLFISIACASILAKTARDEYILALCEENTILKTNYGIEKNMGYGTKTHLEGIRTHGITKWHRKTYGICKNFF
jgi:ribonuclease HII